MTEHPLDPGRPADPGDHGDRRLVQRPFALLVAVAVASLALPSQELRMGSAVAALVTMGGLVGLQLWAGSPRQPRWIQLVPVLGSFVAIALLRDATGGSASGLSPLVMVPALDLALTGSRRELWTTAGLSGLTFVVPELVVGAPRYTSEDWRRALLWVAVVGLLGPIVHELVVRLAQEGAQARRSEGKLRSIIDSAELSGVIVTDVGGTITMFGVGAERLLGHRAAQMVGRRSLGDLHDPREVEAVADELAVAPDAVFASLAAARAPSRIWRWVRADGSEVLVRSAVTELRDAGAVVGYVAVAIDVTDAVRSREALRDADARWRVVMNHLPDTTLIVVDQGSTVSLVAGAGAMREKLQGAEGRPLAKVVSADNVEVLGRLTTQALTGASGRAELNSERTGHEHQIVVVPLPRESGPPDALILARDVSQERAREQALLLAKQRAERLFADAPVPILLHDLDGVVILANPAALRLFEVSRDDLLGVGLAALSGSGPDEAIAEHLAALRGSPAGALEGRWPLRLFTGREMFLRLSSRQLLDDPHHPDLVLTHVLDQTEQRRYEQQLVHLADHDPLTGLANRRRFDAELRRHLERCRRYGAEGAVLMVDLDRFKQVNDTAGHAAGDALIAEIADLLRHELRASDLVARLGGDEFAVLLPRARREDARDVARWIVDGVREAMSRHTGPQGLVTASVGIALVDDREVTAEQLLATADLTLYDAKQAGRDRFALLAAPRATAEPESSLT